MLARDKGGTVAKKPGMAIEGKPLRTTMYLLLWIDWLLRVAGARSSIELSAQDTIVREYVFNLTVSYRNPAGFYKNEFLVNSQSPGPLIVGNENDWVKVTVNNFLPVSDTIHFHGILQKGSPWSDGVPGISQYPILSGDSYIHYFQLKDHFGPAWYHSHNRGYSADGIYGPVYVRPAANRSRPYNLVTNNSADLQLILQLEDSPQFILVEDYFKQPMDTNIAKMLQFGIEPTCISAILINGKGRVVCADTDLFKSTSEVIDSMGCIQDPGCTGYADLRQELDHSLLENPGFSTCQPTFGDQYTLFTNGSEWQYIAVINTGPLFTKVFSIDDHDIYVVAIDGIFIFPQKVQQVQLPVGSRISCLVETKAEMHRNTTNPFLIRFAATLSPQFVEGVGLLRYGVLGPDNDESNLEVIPTNGIRLQNFKGTLMGNLKSFKIENTIPYVDKLDSIGESDHTFHLFLNRTGVIEFSMFLNGTKIPAGFETSQPLYFGRKYLAFMLDDQIRNGDVVDIVINNFRRYNHPIHLHGHLFHLISFSNSSAFNHNTVQESLLNDFPLIQNPPYFDSVLIPPSGHAVIRFVANNPGYWLIHCHNLAHLLGGMGAIIADSIENLPIVPNYLKDQIHVDHPIEPDSVLSNHDLSFQKS